MTPEEAYRELLRISKEIGYPVIYKTDLTTFDHDAIKQFQPTKFIWCLRECGTDLWIPPTPDTPPKERAFAIDWMRLTVKMHPEIRAWLFSKGVLKEIDQKKAFPNERLFTKSYPRTDNL